ncbi:MAG: hypothetical protein HFI36_03560 [Bacilli bacterium]|jgi:hypothetical protein|nr:hypothetical protein [Bacilli bacterium]MCX4253668.1 hypothetical protein [Bacilli bacterium]
MKVRELILTLIVVTALLVYSLFCYKLVNKTYDSNTRFIINNYLEKNFGSNYLAYDFVNALNNSDNTISIFIKAQMKDKNDYYRVILERNGASYRIVNVNQNIPSYIK